MSPTESQKALVQLEALYALTRRAPLTADEHDAAKRTAQALAAHFHPYPEVAPGPSSAVEKTVAQFTPKDGAVA